MRLDDATTLFSREFIWCTRAQKITLLSAIRGPDEEGEEFEAFKARYTATVRRWVFTEEAYETSGFAPQYVPIPTYDEVTALCYELTVILWGSSAAKLTPGRRHYFTHALSALQVIKRNFQLEADAQAKAETK